MNKTVCKKDMCVGCMECLSICPVNAIKIEDSMEAYNAVIDIDKCISCNRCHSICQNNRTVNLLSPKEWYQGWAHNENIRKNSSSGGLATAIAIEFVKNNNVVCSCVFEKGEFVFKIAKTIEDVKQFAGSKYVKSSPKGIYEQIQGAIKSDKKVLFIGLPCQAEAVRNYIGAAGKSKLYTIDLICHGTPSPRLFNDYINKYASNINEIKKISFRKKTLFFIRKDDKPIAPNGTVDWYSLAFLCAINYTKNCYSCKFASTDRGSDLTLGDSWGSKLSIEEQKKGISLILCQTDKGKELIEQSDVDLFDVDSEIAVKFNSQLRRPCHRTERTNKFFHNYNGNFHYKVFTCLTWKCIKQIIKGFLIGINVYPEKNA